MLLQIHWQKISDLTKTEFVAQGNFATGADAFEWARATIEARRNEIPKGWGPLVCDERSPLFTRVVA